MMRELLKKELRTRHPNESAPDFSPDMYQGVAYPLELCGYTAKLLRDVNSDDQLVDRIYSIRDATAHCWKASHSEHWRVSYPCLRNGTLLERELTRLSCQYHGNAIGTAIDQTIGRFRVADAVETLRHQSPHDYHALAYLYVALTCGEDSVGDFQQGVLLATSLRALRSAGVQDPTILLVGFSTVYAIEHLCAIINLIGFRRATVVAMNIAPYPIRAAEAVAPHDLYGVRLRYLQQDAAAIAGAFDSFHMVVTHRLFGSLTGSMSSRVLKEVVRVLRPGGVLIGSEIVSSVSVQGDALVDGCASFADRYFGNEVHRDALTELLREFGRQTPFNPFPTLEALRELLSSAGFSASLTEEVTHRRFAVPYIQEIGVTATK